MTNRIAAPLIAAAVGAAGVSRPSIADTLIVSPIAATNEDTPSEGGISAPFGGPDARIAARVREAFIAQRGAEASDARVDVRNGIVILSGLAVSEESRAAATAYARGVEGVLGVENRMKVAGSEVSVRSTTLDKMNDASVTVRVKAALYLDRSTRTLKPRVRTKDGVVTLNGTARDTAQRDLIGRVVSALDGIAAVNNRMTIAR